MLRNVISICPPENRAQAFATYSSQSRTNPEANMKDMLNTMYYRNRVRSRLTPGSTTSFRSQLLHHWWSHSLEIKPQLLYNFSANGPNRHWHCVKCELIVPSQVRNLRSYTEIHPFWGTACSFIIGSLPFQGIPGRRGDGYAWNVATRTRTRTGR